MSRISVIGLGKLGCCMAAVFSGRGHKVVGIDNNPHTVDLLNNKKAPAQETDLQDWITAHPFRATEDYAAAKNTESTFIVVPTPSDQNGRFANVYLLQVAVALGKVLSTKKNYHVVTVCSTTMPGTMAGVFSERLLQAAGKTASEIGICFSPQFIALGSVIRDMTHPDIVLLGESDPRAGERVARLLRSVSDAPIRHMSLTNAEIAKISVNAYVTMKINFANTLAEICERVPDSNAHVIADAIGLDRRIGRRYLTPATAAAGPCFPRDSLAFTRFAGDVGVEAELAKATDVLNRRQTTRIADIIDRYAETPVTVAILGLTYKPFTHITDESPGIALANTLIERGYQVNAYDPALPPGSLDLDLFKEASSALGMAKIAVIMTPWPEFATLAPACFILKPSLLIIDAWNCLDEGPWDDSNVIRIGIYNGDQM